MGHNFPNLVLRYKPEAAEHYRLLNHELDQRIAEGGTFANLNTAYIGTDCPIGLLSTAVRETEKPGDVSDNQHLF